MGVPTAHVRDRGQGPYRKWAAITPSDTVAITKQDGRLPDAIVALSAGDAVLVDSEGTTLTFAMAADTVYNFGPVRVNATDTTASSIYGLWG